MPTRKTIFLPLLLSALLVFGQEPLIKRVRKSITGIQPFQVDFVHQVFIDEEKDFEESGEIVFVNPERIKWHYRKPENKIFILEGSRYQFFIEESNQLLRGGVDKNNKQVIWQLLFSQEDGRDIQCDEKKRTIRIYNDSKDEFFDMKITLGNDDLPAVAVQTDPWGVRTVYRFRHYQKNRVVGPHEFELKLPQNVEIIDESENE